MPILQSSRPSVLASALVLTMAVGCSRSAPPAGDASPAADDGPVVVYAVNYPLQYFAERIGGELVEARFPMPAGAGDPAHWRPDVETISDYQKADLILLNGAGYAKWVEVASLPYSRMVETSAAVSDRFIDVEATATHSHGPAGEHSHAGTATTIWLDFDIAIAQSEAIRDAMTELRPGEADRFAAACTALADDLRDLGRKLDAATDRFRGRRIVLSQPVYQYWAKRSGLDAMAVMWEPDVVPDDEAMKGLADVLADHPATIMIWEADPDPRSVERLAEIGIQSVVFDPCAAKPGSGDFLSVMQENVERLATPIAP